MPKTIHDRFVEAKANSSKDDVAAAILVLAEVVAELHPLCDEVMAIAAKKVCQEINDMAHSASK